MAVVTVLLQQLEAVHLGHVDVDQQQVNGLSVQDREGFDAVGGLHRGVSGHAKGVGQELAHSGFIIHDENRRLGHRYLQREPISWGPVSTSGPEE